MEDEGVGDWGAPQWLQNRVDVVNTLWQWEQLISSKAK